MGLFGGEIGLFCGEMPPLAMRSGRCVFAEIWGRRDIELLCGSICLFCGNTALFCGGMGLFCGGIPPLAMRTGKEGDKVGLFCGNIGLFGGDIPPLAMRSGRYVLPSSTFSTIVCVAMCCSVLQCVATCCNVLQVLQCVAVFAVCCSVLPSSTFSTIA